MSTDARIDSLQAPQDSAVSVVLELGRALQRFGVPTRRIEQVLTQTAERLGTRVEVFATLTALIVTFGSAEHMRTTFVRLTPSEVDLAALAQLDRIVHRFLDDGGSTAELRRDLARLETRYFALSPWLRFTVAACGAAGWSGLLGGARAEALCAAVAGALVEGLAALTERHGKLTREFNALAGILAGASVTLLSVFVGPVARELATIGALIPFLPGLSLVTAAQELASKDTLTGSSRLVGACLIFAQLIFGVAIGLHVQSFLPSAAAQQTPPLSRWPFGAQVGMLLPAVLGLAMRLRSDVRDLGWFYASGLLGFVSGRIAAPVLGFELAAFLGAFVVGTVAHVSARWLGRSALLTIVPGVLVLVPGSLGFRSASALWAARPLEGVSSGFAALIVAVALATGLMLAGSVVPPRRAL